MSKAFTKDSDDGIDDLLLVEDIALPNGVKNYTTPEGFARLRDDITRLRDAPRADPRKKLLIEQRMHQLQRRLDASEVIDASNQPSDVVRFGAVVTVRDERDQSEHRFRIDGIYEADPKRGWTSWRAPVAKALLGKSVGDSASARTPAGVQGFDIIDIKY